MLKPSLFTLGCDVVAIASVLLGGATVSQPYITKEELSTKYTNYTNFSKIKKRDKMRYSGQEMLSDKGLFLLRGLDGSITVIDCNCCSCPHFIEELFLIYAN